MVQVKGNFHSVGDCEVRDLCSNLNKISPSGIKFPKAQIQDKLHNFRTSDRREPVVFFAQCLEATARKKEVKKENTPHYVTTQVTTATEIGAL